MVEKELVDFPNSFNSVIQIIVLLTSQTLLIVCALANVECCPKIEDALDDYPVNELYVRSEGNDRPDLS